MKNTINKNKKIINWKNEFIKWRFNIYLEKMIKKNERQILKKIKMLFWKNIFKFKKYNKFQKIPFSFRIRKKDY